MAGTSIIFAGRDGTRLGGALTLPDAPKAGPLVTGGTGFPARYYARFADAAAKGYAVLTFDPRGVDASAPDDLAGYDIHYARWGTLDAPAALDERT